MKQKVLPAEVLPSGHSEAAEHTYESNLLPDINIGTGIPFYLADTNWGTRLIIISRSLISNHKTVIFCLKCWELVNQSGLMNIGDLSKIKALAFDVGGSVFDWKTAVRCGIEEMAGNRGVHVDSESFAMNWRGRMFERLQAVRMGTVPWANADTLHRQALDDLSDRYVDLRLSDEDKDELNLVWHRMPAWADVSPALVRLRDSYVCVVLTLLSLKIVIDSSRFNGISWDGIISCEFLGHYKPHPEAYRAGCRLLGLTPQEVMMVAAHTGDLRAARSAGLRTAFVEPKLNEPAETGDNTLPEQGEFDFVDADYGKLADLLCGISS